MAQIENLLPVILHWEGGYVNDPVDRGGPTNKGVTLDTWKRLGYDKNDDEIIDEEDLKLLTQQDFRSILLVYWNRWKADQIVSQPLANILVDWVWGSGKYGIILPQKILGVQPDGVVGRLTLQALNNHPNSKQLFDEIKQERVAHIERICQSRPANLRFRKGWLRRINSFSYGE